MENRSFSSQNEIQPPVIIARAHRLLEQIERGDRRLVDENQLDKLIMEARDLAEFRIHLLGEVGSRLNEVDGLNETLAALDHLKTVLFGIDRS